jgi:hypothetical protein
LKFAPVFCALTLFLQVDAAAQMLRGSVEVEREQVYAVDAGVPYPLDGAGVKRIALENAAALFGAMIYGWDFEYCPGDKARGTSEYIILTPQGHIDAADKRLSPGEAAVKNGIYTLWANYEMSAAQARRFSSHKTVSIQTDALAGGSFPRTVNTKGRAPLDGPCFVTEDGITTSPVLEDAAKNAVRGILRASERNKPRLVRGALFLDGGFPLFTISQGSWTCSAAFLVTVTELLTYSAYYGRLAGMKGNG